MEETSREVQMADSPASSDKSAVDANVTDHREFIPPSQRDDAPLAGIIPPELDDIDPRKFFPEFEQGGHLRFSRIFANTKPSMKEQIWWTSKTFRKKPPAAKVSTEEEELAAIETLKQTSLAKSDEKTGEKSEEQQIDGKDGDAIDAEKPSTSGWDFRIGGPPKKEDCYTDEYELLCAENLEELLNQKQLQQSNEEDDESAPPWRYGPAQIWYDQMGLPPNPKNFDYGMKRRGATALKNSTIEESSLEDDKTFLPVNLVHWEDDIIIDGEKAKEKLIKELSSAKLPRCGWIPTSHTRTYKAFMTAWKNKSFIEYLENPTRVTQVQNAAGTSSDATAAADSRLPIDSQHSIFPFENYELEYTNWEDDIIWDSANMPAIPKPRVLTLDYEHDPKLFGMPEDLQQDEADLSQQLTSRSSMGKEQGGMKKSKLILAQVFKRQRQEEEEQIETQVAQIADKDPFNLSNDEYYLPKNNTKSQRSFVYTSTQHSLPAQNIHPTFFPYLASISQMRNFHRPRLTPKMLHGLSGRNAPVLSLARHVRKTNQKREHQSEGGAFDIFLMRELYDLSGRDGTLLLLEYSEEYPPLLNQTGMASKIRNYFKRKPTKEQEMELEFGETAFTHTSPFLGNLSTHQSLQAIENNMFRATIFKHRAQNTDFLLIRHKFGFFLRYFPALFLVGQELPLYEVPSPNSKRAKDFNREYMMSHIYRLFWQSEEKPRRVRMDEIRRIFPNQEGIIRKNLKQCAEMKKIGSSIEIWVQKEDFRLPSKEEVANMLTPEMYCAQASMMAAEQRLRDAGYGEKYLHVPENADDSDDQQIGEEEIKCAPWNTTRAYMATMKGKCFLDQTGLADPSGAGLGFSFVRVSAKPPKVKDKEEVEKETAPKKLVTGTNADLRKLPLKEARQMCREFGLTEEEINSLERWDVIDVIRTMSTQAAQGKIDSQVARFARGNARITFADMQNKHKEHCQRIFDKQNKWLSNTAPEVHDLDWESNDDEGIGKRYAGVYSTTTTLSDAERHKLEFEREERERVNLQKMIRGEVTKTGSVVSAAAKEAVIGRQERGEGAHDAFVVPNPQSPSASATLLTSGSGAQRKLKIYRTIRNLDGTESTRVETVTHSQLIEAYVRIRSTRDDSFIKVYAQMDDKYKEEKRKERRRQQENARRAKKGDHPPGQQQQKTSSAPNQKKQESVMEMPLSTAPEQQQPRPAALPKTQQLPPGKPQQQKQQTQQQQQRQPSPAKPGPKPKKEKAVVAVAPPPPVVEKIEKPAAPPPPAPAKPPKEIKITCSACGEVGHMKTNRNCPLYGKEEDLATKTVGEICQPSSSRLSDIPDEEGDRLPSGELIEVEGTRIKFSKKLYKHAQANKERKNALRLHIPRKILETGAAKKKPKKPPTIVAPVEQPIPPQPTQQQQQQQLEEHLIAPSTSGLKEEPGNKQQRALTITVPVGAASSSAAGPPSAISSASSTGGGGGPLSAGAVKRRGTLEEADYLVGPQKSVHRRRADPRVSMASLFMEILNEFKGVDGAEHFAFPVNIKKVPDYLNIVKKPMDLQQIRKNITENKYELRRQFLSDLTQILVNSSTYNGPTHSITEGAKRMLQFATKKLEENEQKLIELEKQINPLLDDDDMVGFSYILLKIVQECKNLPKSAAFHSRVDSKKFPQYNEKIQRPMDLGTIEQNIKDHRYTTVAAFKRDMEQILTNSQIFNGPQSAYTAKAVEIVNLSNQLLDQSQGNLAELEANIQRALNANDDGTASSAAGDDRASLASWVSSDLAAAERQITSAVGGQPGDELLLLESEAAEVGSLVPPEGEEEELVASPAPEMDLLPPPAEVPKFYMGDEEEEEGEGEEEQEMPIEAPEEEGALLHEDLALSNDEDDETEAETAAVEAEAGEERQLDEEEETQDKVWDQEAVSSQLLQSGMHTSGQLNADLALSESDEDEDEALNSAKRPRLDDLHSSF